MGYCAGVMIVVAPYYAVSRYIFILYANTEHRIKIANLLYYCGALDFVCEELFLNQKSYSYILERMIYEVLKRMDHTFG